MIWKLGIFLMILGIVVLVVLLAITIKDITLSLKNTQKILTNKKSQLEKIKNSGSNIQQNVKIVGERVSNFTRIALILGILFGMIKTEEEKIETNKNTWASKFKEIQKIM